MDENSQTSQEILEQIRVQTIAINSLAEVFAKTMTKEQREQWLLEQNIKRTGNAFDRLGGNLNDLSEAEKARIAGEREAAVVTNALKKSVADTTKGLFNLSSTLSNTTADLTKWSNTISGVGDVAMSVGKHFGVLGNVIGGTIKGFSVLAPMLLDQTQKMLKAFDSLSEMGGTTNMTTDQVRQLGRASGYTVDNLDKFVNAVKIVGKDINALGVNSAQGTKLFGQMTAVGEKNIQSYNRLGISQEQLTEAQAMYVKQTSNAGMVLSKSPKELQRASLDYIDELVKLKELTGMSVKEQQSALDQAMAQENFNAYLHAKSMERTELEARAEKESDPVRQKELKARAEQIDQVIASKKELAAWSVTNESARDSSALLQSISRDTAPVITEANAHFLIAGRNIDGVADSLNQGKSALRDYQGEIAKSVKYVNKTMGEGMYAYGDASKGIQQAMGVDNQARKNAARFIDLETEAGRKRAAEEDKAIQEQIKRRKEQGEIIDPKTGKAMRDGAKDTENAVLSLERSLRELKDDLLGALNPFTKTTFLASAASFALATAAGYAAFKLGKLGMGGLGDMGDLLKKGLPGASGPRGGPGPKMPGGFTPEQLKQYKDLRKGGMTASAAKNVVTAAAGSNTAVTAASSSATALGRLAGPLTKLAKAAPAIGTVMSVGEGTIDAYQGIKKADKDLKEGTITKEEAKTAKGEAVGGGVGTAAGGIGGAWGGAAAGAAMGLALGPLGAAVGGILGAAVGGWLGSKGGKAIGEAAGGSIAKMTADADNKRADKTGNLFDNDAENKNFEIYSSILDQQKQTNVLIKDLSRMALTSLVPDIDSIADNIEDLTKFTILKDVRDIEAAKKIGEIRERTLSGSSNKVSSPTSDASQGATPAKPPASGITGSISSIFGGSQDTGSSSSKPVGGAGTPNGSVDRLLDVIGKKESGGDYNILVGGKKADLENMPVSKVLDFQSRMRSLGFETSAVGKYQIIRNTLLETMPKAGVGMDDLFNRSTQDKLGTALLKRRGLDEYLTKKIDPEMFADNLSKEWASLPYKTGKSYYAGVGSNASSMSREELLNSLPKAKSGGVFDGPESGYPVMLHGNEAVVPLNNSSTNSTNNLTENLKDLVSLQQEMLDKLDTVIDKLSSGNDIQDKLLQYSRV